MTYTNCFIITKKMLNVTLTCMECYIKNDLLGFFFVDVNKSAVSSGLDRKKKTSFVIFFGIRIWLPV